MAARVATGRRILLVMYPEVAQTMLAEGRRRQWREKLTWISPDDGIAVNVINPSHPAADTSTASPSSRYIQSN